MKERIWRELIRILSYRKDLINTIKPFLDNLNNNNKKEQYCINDKQTFLLLLSKYNLKLLYEYEIVNEEKYKVLMSIHNFKIQKNSESSNNDEEIIEGDKSEELQKLIREKDFRTINTIAKEFNEVQKMKIPILIYCVIQKAIKCFKYLLINGIDDPTLTMQEENPDPQDLCWINRHRYEWDCMAIAIYYG